MLAHPADSKPDDSVTGKPGRRDGSIRLADGRRLSYAEYGDPTAPAVLYFHGYPSSRLEAGLSPVTGVRLIAPDRPGYGGSDPMPGRQLTDWPADIAALLDALGIARAGVFGMSGGGPYAAACAEALPDRITGAALVSAMGPPGMGWERGGSAAFVMLVGRWRWLFTLVALLVRWLIGRGTAARRAELLVRRSLLSGGDRQVLRQGLGVHLVGAIREGLRPGIWGAVSDAGIYAHPWGLDLGRIRVPVSIWHGTADVTVPVAAAHAYASRIPGAKLHLFPGDGHFDLVAREKQAILEDLLQQR